MRILWKIVIIFISFKQNDWSEKVTLSAFPFLIILYFNYISQVNKVRDIKIWY